MPKEQVGVIHPVMAKWLVQILETTAYRRVDYEKRLPAATDPPRFARREIGTVGASLRARPMAPA